MSSPTPSVGSTLGRYRITEQIGAGGMGVVFLAFDERLQREVALKVLPPGLLRDEQARKRFRNEALALSKLNHPNVATVHDFDSENGVDFLVTEYIAGQSLDELVSVGPLSADEVLRLAAQLAEGLAAAHERGVIHRDLKPANVRITGDGRLKILDFGLAKLRRDAHGVDEATLTASLTVTEPGSVSGTLPYMAPEQLRGQTADARTDIWAAGCVLYELASSRRPFSGQTAFELSSGILNRQPAPLPDAVPLRLRAIIERCLAKEPEQRFQSASELRAVLLSASTAASAAWLTAGYLTRRKFWLLPVATLLLGALLVAGLPGLRQSLQRLLGWGPQVGSIAVLPLKNVSGNAEQDYFAEGVHESLTTELARVSGFSRVIARPSAMRYRDSPKPLREIARELNVDALLTGSVMLSRDRVRITAQLIQADTEEHLWAASYERSLRDVLTMQNEMVSTIVREIRVTLTPEEAGRLAHNRPADPRAYQAYLRGRFFLNKFTPDGFKQGLSYMHQAVEYDPADPLAYAGLALAYSLIGHDVMPDAFVRAKAAAERALELDPGLADAQEALAEIKVYRDFDLPGAERAFRRALELNPNLAQAHAHYAWYVLIHDRHDEAIAEMRRATELDPLNPLWAAWLAWLYWEAGQHDQAIAQARQALQLNPNFPWSLYVLGGVYAEKRMYEQAIASHQKAVNVNRDLRWGLAHSYALAGYTDEARKLLRELEQKPTPMDKFGLAVGYAALGEKALALEWLEKAYDSRFSWMPWIRDMRELRPLYDEPRFQGLARRMNLP
jgi:serine/threonine protein kinase/tetratricopeptide (TPR) repeat protein